MQTVCSLYIMQHASCIKYQSDTNTHHLTFISYGHFSSTLLIEAVTELQEFSEAPAVKTKTSPLRLFLRLNVSTPGCSNHGDKPRPMMTHSWRHHNSVELTIFVLYLAPARNSAAPMWSNSSTPASCGLVGHQQNVTVPFVFRM